MFTTVKMLSHKGHISPPVHDVRQVTEAMSGTYMYARQSFKCFIKEYEEFRQTIKKMPEEADLRNYPMEGLPGSPVL